MNRRTLFALMARLPFAGKAAVKDSIDPRGMANAFLSDKCTDKLKTDLAREVIKIRSVEWLAYKNISAKLPKLKQQRDLALQIAEFKASIHGLFIGGLQRRRDHAKEGMFIFKDLSDKQNAVKAMAMHIESALGSDVKHSEYSVFLIEPPENQNDVLLQRGYMGWKFATS